VGEYGVDIGIATLTDVQPHTVDGRTRTVEQRTAQIVRLGVQADQLGLDHLGVGEHHSVDFAVASPAVVLAAIASRTSRLRLTSSVSTLGALDPVRLYQDFATVDLISGGRAEITVGRSAYPDPFALFGEPIQFYDDLFTEKLDLLLQLRSSPRVTWRGRFRPALDDAPIVPRPVQDPLPIWVGVGGTPASAERAGALGLPMILGYIGGTADRLAALATIYRRAADRAGHAESARVGVGVHFFAAEDETTAAETYPYYRDFLRPKSPGGGGFDVEPEHFRHGLSPNGHLAIGTPEQVTEKLLALHRIVGFDRLQALPDWGGLPEDAVTESVRHLAETIAPVLRTAIPVLST